MILCNENQFWITNGAGEKISGHINILDVIIEKLTQHKKMCSCLLVYNDVAANYIIDGLKEKGMAVSQNIAIASFDNTLLAQTKKITSIAQPINGQDCQCIQSHANSINRLFNKQALPTSRAKGFTKYMRILLVFLKKR